MPDMDCDSSASSITLIIIIPYAVLYYGFDLPFVCVIVRPRTLSAIYVVNGISFLIQEQMFETHEKF